MKPNTFLYLLYGLYALIAVLLFKYIILTPDGGLLIVIAMWFVPPVIIALIPIIVVKKYLLKYLIPKLSRSNDIKIALHSTLKSIGVPFTYTAVLALFASMLRMVAPERVPLFLGDISQTNSVILVEVAALLMLFAWVNRFVDYHIVWPMIKEANQMLVRRALLYGNMIGYMILTVIFAVWQLMIFYQWPEWLWNMI